MEHTKDFNIFLATDPAESLALIGHYPNILNSYHYFKTRPDVVKQVCDASEKYILDSGAFSAFTMGKCIYLDEYMEYVQGLELLGDPKFEAMTLDVIGDGVKTFAMQKKFIEAGMDVMPVFHYGSDMGQLVTICNMGVERLAFGGLVGRRNTREFLDEAWKIVANEQQVPMRIHGLGLTNFRDMMRYPWWSVDSSTISSSFRFGRAWQSYDRNARRFGGSCDVHDYIRQYLPEWENKPLGTEPLEALGGISIRDFLVQKQSVLWSEAQDHLRELRLQDDYGHIGSQGMFDFCSTAPWTPVDVPDDELPLIAPPSVRGGGGASLEMRQVDWNFSEHVIDDTIEPDLPGVVAIDFETFYTSEYSVKKLGHWAYSQDDQFKTYCISIYGNERAWCGPVDMFDWNWLRGNKVLAHNVGFEKSVIERLVQDGIAPEWTKDIDWFDTIDLCGYLNLPRALDKAMMSIFGESLDKDVRDRLSSCNCTEEEVVEYCLEDSRSSFRIYKELHKEWPSHEQRISTETRRMGHGTIDINREKAEEWIEEISGYLEEQAPFIPFTPAGSDAKAEKYIKEKWGFDGPENWQTKSPLYMGWKAQLGKDARDWVILREDFKKARKILKTIESIITRTDCNAHLMYQLKYFGATTGRWSGAGGLNMQNWHRKARWDIRSLLVAPPGYILGIHDFAQIEARSLLWLVNDTAQLDLIREVGDVYEAHARSTMGYVDPRPMKIGDPDMRHLSKARVLALGYGCGDINFQFMAKSLCDLDLTPEVCSETVLDYRETNYRIVDYWKQKELEAKACLGGAWSNVLPSGRSLTYRGLHNRKVEKEWNGELVKRNQLFAQIGHRTLGIYGGLLVENENQAFCRDIMSSAWLRCANAGYLPSLTVHDELVFLYPEETAERDLAVVDALMSRVPAWCAGLPLEVEGELSKHYKK